MTHNLNGRVLTGWIEQDRESERGGTVNFMALDTLQWHDYYITIRRGGAGTHRVTVYLDGDLTPAVEWDVTAGAGHFNDDITYVALAMGSTEQSGSIEIDFLIVARGVAPPRSERTVFRRGDCNDDGRVDVSDAACALNWLFATAPDPGCLASLNTNGDGNVDIADPVAILNFLFASGAAPVAPFPECGPGTLPADEELGCAKPPDCQ